MKLLRLHIENFGGLQNYDLELSSGLNSLCHPNGWGKSTLAVFIKAMLYGLPAGTKRSLDENERKKYTPWQGGLYGGSLEFSTADGSFRIERSFGEKEAQDSFAVYDLATRLPSDRFSDAPGLDLFGIDAEGFERTVYLSQRAINEKSEHTGITAKLGDLLDDVDDIGSFDRAMELLDKRRKYFVLKGDRGRISELERELGESKQEKDRLLARRTAEESKRAELKAAQASLEEIKQELLATRGELDRARLSRERDALQAQKNRMLAELSKKDAEKRAVDQRLHGRHPEDRELSRVADSVRALQAAEIRLDTYRTPEEAAHRREALHRRFAKGLPPSSTLERWEEQARLLPELSRRRRALEAAADRAIPSEGELKAVETLWECARQSPPKEHPSRTSSRLPSVLCMVLGGFVALGAVLLAPSLLLQILIASVGLLGAVGGLMWFLLSARRDRRMLEACKAEAAAQARRREADLSRVREWLRAQGRGRNEDPSAALAAIASARREAVWKQKQQREEARTLAREEARYLESLRSGLGAIGSHPPQSEEELLRVVRVVLQEAGELARLESEERTRSASRRAEQERIEGLKAELRPFLSHYDPESKRTPADTLADVTEWEKESRRLSREYAEQEAEMRRFLSEKKLSEAPFTPATRDYDTLKELEDRLTHCYDDRQKQNHRLLQELELLSAETEALPEVEQHLMETEEALRQARADSRIIQKTMDLLEASKTALSTRYLDGMQRALTEYLGMLWGERTLPSELNAKFAVSLRSGGQTRELESFSRGERDAVRFCRRLSLTSALYGEGERPPLILDDPFVNLDDETMKAARGLMRHLSEEYQILYLVCREERA